MSVGINRKEGFVLVVIMGLMAVMVFTVAATSLMIQQDVALIYRIKTREQARLLAEAGMNRALVKIGDEGYPAFPRTDFVTGSMDTGSYSADLVVRGGRHLVVSSGTSSGVTRTVSAEVKDDTPTALQYFSGAGNDISIYSFIAGSNINGDLHANGDVSLMSGRWIANLNITGDVSATGVVTEGTTHAADDDYDDNVFINALNNDTATVYEGAEQITFPTFNYADYQQEASDSGDYYSGDQAFSGTLTPVCGVIYVDGDVEITGDTELTGGIIADNINIGGGFFGTTLTQNKVGDDKYNVIIAKDGDLRVYGRLYTEKALLYASQDIRSALALAVLDVNGVMLAGRNISMWNFITIIDYNYVPVSPDIAESFQVVSWNS